MAEMAPHIRFRLILHSLRIPATLILLLGMGLSLQSCAASPTSSQLRLMPRDELPPSMQQAPVAVREAYQFAAANPDVLRALPCYCGCGSVGHTSNLDCYLAASDSPGQITFDAHALGCTLCVDITQDAMRMLREGKPLPVIREYVDARYARFGPSNMP
jgi:hypothetical protein